MGPVADKSCALNEEMTRGRSMCRPYVFKPKHNERMTCADGFKAYSKVVASGRTQRIILCTED